MPFRGVAHLHSTLSFDGHLPLDRLATFLSDRGVQFALVSEHVETLDAPKVQQLIGECRACSTESFLMIPGIEIDALNALFYGIVGVDAWTDNDDLARQLAASGAMVIVSHPVKVKGPLPKLTASLVEGVEIWNTRYDGKLAIDLSMLQYWRSLERQLRRRLLPVCGIDFHSTRDFASVTFNVDCERLDTGELLNAIRSGRYVIARAGKAIPLDVRRGTLPVRYTLYSRCYRTIFVLAHVLHRGMSRLGLKMPTALKVPLRRLFC
jgi:hypothetical protein